MVTSEEILKIASLAKLFIDESEIEQLTKDMSQIIRFADTINMKIEDENAECNDINEINNIINAFREDEIIESLNRKDILKNRSNGVNGFFVI